METKDIILSIVTSNAICLGISFGIFFIMCRIVQDYKDIMVKQVKVIFFTTFLNGLVTSFFTNGMLFIVLLSCLSFVLFDNIGSIVSIYINKRGNIINIVKEYIHGVFLIRNGMHDSMGLMIISLILTTLGWLVYMVGSYFFR